MASLVRWQEAVEIKIKRAKRHADEFRVERERFFNTDPRPYEIAIDEDRKPGKVVWLAKVKRQPSPELGAVAADAIHNLRSALDHLWCGGLWYPEGGGRDNTKCAFPSFRTLDGCRASFKAVIPTSRKGKLAAIAEKFHEVQTDGNSHLWLMAEADNEDKHRLYSPAYSFLGATSFDFGGSLAHTFRDNPAFSWTQSIPEMRLGLRWAEPLYPVENDAIVYECPVEAKGENMALDPRFHFEIAFGESGVLAGKPILETLNAFTTMAERIVEEYRVGGFL
jgi:hypothetical protein